MNNCQVYEWETILVLLWVVVWAHSVHLVVPVVPVVVRQYVPVLANLVQEDLPYLLRWKMVLEMQGLQVVQAVPEVPADIHRILVLEEPVEVPKVE